MTDDERSFIRNVLRNGESATEDAEHEIGQRPDRREVAKIALLSALVLSLLMGAVSISVSLLAMKSTAENAAIAQANADDLENNRDLAEEAYRSAQAANDALERRGQEPVPVPPPNPNNPSDTLASAAAARVLAQLPDADPSASELGKAVADYLIANPITPKGPTPGQIADAVARYLASNPPRAGPAGPQGAAGPEGPAGRAPTASEIQQAFSDYITDNPGFLATELCRPDSANWEEAKNLESADGALYTIYGCVTEVENTSPTETAPAPTTDPATE